MDTTPETREILSLSALIRTAVQVALACYAPSEEDDAEIGPCEDAAVERVQALLTPQGRLQLAAELLRPIDPRAVTVLGYGDSAADLLLSIGGVETAEVRAGRARGVVRLCLGDMVVLASRDSRPATPEEIAAHAATEVQP